MGKSERERASAVVTLEFFHNFPNDMLSLAPKRETQNFSFAETEKVFTTEEKKERENLIISFSWCDVKEKV